MRWIEVIRLLIPADRIRRVAAEFDEIITETGQAIEGVISARTCLNADQSGDLVLALFWEAGPPQAQGTRIALSMSSTLKHLGLVQYSVQTEGARQDQGEGSL
jgi:hypothetical protein